MCYCHPMNRIPPFPASQFIWRSSCLRGEGWEGNGSLGFSPYLVYSSSFFMSNISVPWHHLHLSPSRSTQGMMRNATYPSQMDSYRMRILSISSFLRLSSTLTTSQRKKNAISCIWVAMQAQHSLMTFTIVDKSIHSKKIAIVRPFTYGGIRPLLHNIGMGDVPDVTPCINGEKLNIDLIFYFHR